METEMLQTCCRKSGEGKNNLHKQNGQVQCQSNADCVNERRGNLVPAGISATLRDDENCWEQKSSGMACTDRADNCNGAMQHDIVLEKPKQQKEMTLQDMYNHKEDYSDGDEDDDSDWEPFQKHVDSEKWFCINCTMVNWDDVHHCDVCGEHKDFDILSFGSFASSLAQEAGYTQVKSDFEGSSARNSALDSCTAVGFDERMLLHSEVEMKPHPHPERPDRLRAISATLAAAGIFPGRCVPIPAREITQEELQVVHTQEHIEAVEFTSCMLSSYFTPDTYANEHSACAARLAAGLCADLSSAIMSGHAKNGFALVRPPGHHAGVKDAMGFCLHNNAAVAAVAAQSAGAKKVLIVDWDVHHGNGTQEIFEGSKSVLYVSLHRHEGGKFYPGTGAAAEVGIRGAEGYCVNVPWKCGGVGDSDYVFAFQHIVLPIALEFAPDLTIISAGFDAARGDPLGCCDVTPAGYAQMTHMLTSLSSGKLLVILEGGYNLRSISTSATAVIKVLLGESPGCEVDVEPSKAGLQTVLEVLKVQMKFWPNLESTLTRLQSQCPSFPVQNGKGCLKGKEQGIGGRGGKGCLGHDMYKDDQSYLVPDKSSDSVLAEKRAKKKRRLLVPIWWKWGRKKCMYNLLYGRLGIKVKGRAKSLP
ncbi:Histone deacetylase superfamily [Macleaya cordata]|uniref:histone deacetylase n=1 Tax=Macleaya cordata TaxID=56857 RepID=A0A200Q3K3_MACCD|nr:Histone deacetylase superfamily [Macleaya cordata]